MGVDHSQSSHPYPPSLQLKLYQAFIFSVPILFTIILFLLFYLFYLKRRRSTTPSTPHALTPRMFSQATSLLSLPFDMALKKELREALPVVIFDEENANSRDTQCCVCLGEFERKEQLHQIPSCNHLFHIDCIHHWLIANATCPLCRAPVLPLMKDPLDKFNVVQLAGANSPQEELQQEVQEPVEVVVQPSETLHEGSTTGDPCLSESQVSAQETDRAPVFRIQMQGL